MSTLTVASAATDPADNSFDTGYTDGELAATTGLSDRRARARIEMAEDYDPLYAAGYWHGYEHTASVLALKSA
ncbi:hypothetical protein ACFQ6Q_00195 [Streptomyces sp. NPDC056437]|uniref:hypothetical protein n=1 Tax=Streptomyces sp. NPDC056437 TaxID=3345816 RepID=UPI0036B556BF